MVTKDKDLESEILHNKIRPLLYFFFPLCRDPRLSQIYVPALIDWLQSLLYEGWMKECVE